MVFFLLSLLLLQVYNHVSICQKSWELGQIRRTVTSLYKENGRLYVDVQKLLSHRRIADFARDRFHMVFPTMNQITIYTPESKISSEYFAKL